MKLDNQTIDKTWTLFLDRDGVINERIVGSYVKHTEEFIFLPGVPDTIAGFSQIFGRIIVVTNQQGIGKGYMTECNLSEVHDYMRNQIESAGGKFDAILHAPQLAVENSSFRKPEPGMGLQAKELFPEIDFAKSIMVGDSDSDIAFGKNLGMITVRIGKEKDAIEKSDYYCDKLADCIKLFKL